jgi:predicted enzyme related to lactoylglutathione lyase
MGTTSSTKSRQKLKDFVSWFEIPVYDIHRATAFYNTIYHMEMEMNDDGEFSRAFFPADQGIGGALVAGPGCTPNSTGPLIYLNAGEDIDSVLGRVEPAGGRVIMPRTMISEQAGSFALFIDSEGNRLALHERPKEPAPAMLRVKQTAAPAQGKGTARKTRKVAAKRVAKVVAKTVAKKAAAKRR